MTRGSILRQQGQHGLRRSSDYLYPVTAGLKLRKLFTGKLLKEEKSYAAPMQPLSISSRSSSPLPTGLTDGEPVNSLDALRHVKENPHYNPGLRQLIHVGYKVASEMGKEYTDALKSNSEIIAACVTENIFDRHIARLFRN